MPPEPTTYIVFNLIEGATWIGIGIYLLHKDGDRCPLGTRLLTLLGLLIFGLSDFAEATRVPPLPNWLWWTKLIAGSTLFLSLNLREHYVVGPIPVGRLVVRTTVFVVLLATFLSVTS